MDVTSRRSTPAIKFIDSPEQVAQFTSCVSVKGCQVKTPITATQRVEVDALIKLIPSRLESQIGPYQMNVQCHWSFAAFRDNICFLAKCVVLFGHVQANVEASRYGENILRPLTKGMCTNSSCLTM